MEFLENTHSVVATESIAIQEDVKFAEKLADIFEELQENYMSSGVSDSVKFMSRKSVGALYHEIDRELRKRFGMPVKTITAEKLPYAIMPVQPRGANVIFGDINKKIDTISKELQGKTITCDNPHCLTDFRAQNADVYAQLLKSHKQLTKLLNTSGIVIDNKKAYLEGLDSDYLILILTDPCFIFDIGLTPMECVAILLHEIGHAFTALSESNRIVTQTDTLISAMEDSVNMKPKDRYRLMAKRTFGSANMASKDNEELILLDMLGKLTPVEFKNDINTTRESERMADQFAVRFGIGVELVSSLDKLMKYYSRPIERLTNFSLYVKLFLIAILMTGLGIAIMSVVVGMIIWAGVTFTINLLRMTIIGPESARDETYDTLYNRMVRIKQDYIRQIRLTNNEEYKQMLIKSVKTMNGVMEKYKENPSLFERFGEILPWHSKSTDETKRQRLLEDMIDNELFIN